MSIKCYMIGILFAICAASCGEDTFNLVGKEDLLIKTWLDPYESNCEGPNMFYRAEGSGRIPPGERNKLEILIDELSLGHVRKSNGDVLSGGERRRTEIARALATEPQYILLDEPFAGIDPKAVDDIQNVILYLRNRGIGILVTDHNVRETLGVTDRAYIMTDGRIFRAGVPRELTEDAEVRRLYLGDKFRM